jgi:hypothetical protein
MGNGLTHGLGGSGHLAGMVGRMMGNGQSQRLASGIAVIRLAKRCVKQRVCP